MKPTLRQKADAKLLEYRAEQARTGRYSREKRRALKKASNAYHKAEERWWESLTDAEQLAVDPERVAEDVEWQELLRSTMREMEAREASLPPSNAERVLGVQHGASAQEVKARYRALVKVHHPDVGGDRAEFEKVQKAYDVLEENA